MEIATWIIAIATASYTIAFIITVFYIKGQLKENRLLREATVLKEAYDYIIRTHKFRLILYENAEKLKKLNQLDELEKIDDELSEAIYEVANCYHYIGFLMKHGIITNKKALFEEGGDTFLHIYEILKDIIRLERQKINKSTYKQYLEYFYNELMRYKSNSNRKPNMI